MRTVNREDVGKIARAVSDPVRLEILSRIARCPEGEFACADFRTVFDLTPATISHHIKELTAVELIEARRDGKFSLYRANKARWAAYLRELKKLVPED
jgi:ArsR family transcriptional regulator